MKPKATFSITTLGCKVNQCESDAIGRELETKGIEQISVDGGPDICIVNTCTVTQKASMQSRQAIRKAIKNFPNAQIIVTGCYAQTAPEELAKIDGVSAVVSNADKSALADLLAQPLQSCARQPAIIHHNIHQQTRMAASSATAYGTRSRPFLKIQDGCNAFCTYCIVPYARGRSRSMPPTLVLKNLEDLNDAGFLEVVLTGIHLGCYGLDLTPPTTLFDLLARLQNDPPVARIRLSSIEPMELSDEIIRLVAASKTFCRHFHIPLQSGDDGVLARMKRPYKSKDFEDKVNHIYHHMPDGAIGADVLVGFPGETDAAFENTLALIQRLPLNYLHVFPFSPRKNTPAYGFADKVPTKVIKARCEILRQVGRRKRLDFFKSQIGKTVSVIAEGSGDAKKAEVKGTSGNYLPVRFKTQRPVRNGMIRVRISRVTDDLKVWGEIHPDDR